MPGQVDLTSTTNNTLPGFSGRGTNLAKLFNLNDITNRDSNETELWDTWIVGAASPARMSTAQPRERYMLATSACLARTASAASRRPASSDSVRSRSTTRRMPPAPISASTPR